MATLRNKRKLAAVTRETQEEHPRNGQSRNTFVPRNNEEYVTQATEEIEGRVTKKQSQEFSRTESRILGALSKLDEFLLNQQIRTHSGTVPGTLWDTKMENQGTNEDDSQSDPHPEAGIFRSQITQNSDPEVARDSSLLSAFTRSVCDFLYGNFYLKSNIGKNLRLNVTQSTGQKRNSVQLFHFATNFSWNHLKKFHGKHAGFLRNTT